MAVVGTATLNVVPKISGLSQTVSSEFSKVNAKSLGEQTGSKYTQGVGSSLVKSGAVVGAFAAITNKALQSISSHVGDAVSRFDTLNNYPKVMEALGYSGDAADASIARISDRLQTLPTTLDSMASSVQRMTTITRDIDKATEGSLALNDMLLAGGANQQVVNAAQEQFFQILSKGKPEMQDWRSLMVAAPGQLDQLAKSMLGPTATANDLYAALGGGNNEPIFTMDQLIDKIIELDQKGGDGFASFQEQAEGAVGGVATSAANMGNAVTRGITGVMDAIGRENIVGVINDIKGGINSVFGTVQSVAGGAVPVLKSAWEVIKSIAPALIAGGAATTVFTGAFNGVGKLLTASISPLNAVVLGLGVAATAFTFISGKVQEAKEHEENFTKATTGLSDAVSRTASLDEYKGKLDAVSSAAKSSAMSVNELVESNAKHVDKINEVTAQAEEQIGSLTNAQSVIAQYVGQTDLSVQAQGQLEHALSTVNEQLGLNLTATDVMNGAYTDAEGNVQDLISSVNDLVEAKKREIQTEALSESLGEAYKARADAADTYAAAMARHSEQVKIAETNYKNGAITFDEYQEGLANIDAALERAKQPYDEAVDAVSRLESEMGDAAQATSEAADAYDSWGNKTSDVFRSLLEQGGTSLSMLKDDLRGLGADTAKLERLNETQLTQLAQAYDGTTSSIIELLAGWGISMDEAGIKAAAMASDIQDALEGMDVATPLEEAGIPIADFSQRLADAGVSTETLNAVGSANLAAMAANCGGSIDQMVAQLATYNSAPLVDKEGRVTMDAASLMDAMGNLYTWNGDQLLDKDNQVVVDQVQLTDAQGNLVTWNGTELQDKDGQALVRGNMADAINMRRDWNSGDLWDKECTAIINIEKRVSTTTQNAAGGFRLNAEGGVRYHADGFIATRATVLPQTDIVGEAGAEAIVPLTNRTYAQPFADIIAEGVAERMPKGASDELLRQVVQVLMAILQAIPSFSERDFDRAVRSAVYG